jgi:hypothetical protein
MWYLPMGVMDGARRLDVEFAADQMIVIGSS